MGLSATTSQIRKVDLTGGRTWIWPFRTHQERTKVDLLKHRTLKRRHADFEVSSHGHDGKQRYDSHSAALHACALFQNGHGGYTISIHGHSSSTSPSAHTYRISYRFSQRCCRKEGHRTINIRCRLSGYEKTSSFYNTETMILNEHQVFCPV